MEEYRIPAGVRRSLMVASWQDEIIRTSGGAERRLGDLIAGWRAEVARLRRELDKDADDRTVWGADDYVGSLHLRSTLARAMSNPKLTQTEAASLLSEADEIFRSITEPDNEDLLRRFAPEESATPGWWWGRIPRRGPVRSDLNALSARSAD